MGSKQLYAAHAEIDSPLLSGDAISPGRPSPNSRSANSRMANPWFRLYSEFANDPKVQMMPEHMQRRLVMLMCLRCCNILETLQEAEIAYCLHITEAQLMETKALFLSKKFIDDGWNLLNWDKRQFVSDSSAERTRRYRERLETSRKHSGNVTETSLQRHCDAIEQNRAEQSRCRTETEKTFAQSDEKPVACERTSPEPLSEKRAEGITQAQIVEIYQSYPRRVGTVAAYKAIEKAYRMLRKGGAGRAPLDHSAAIALLLARTKQFAESADGKWAGGEDYRPYPATWFNQGRFLDEAAQKAKRVYVNG